MRYSSIRALFAIHKASSLENVTGFRAGVAKIDLWVDECSSSSVYFVSLDLPYFKLFYSINACIQFEFRKR